MSMIQSGKAPCGCGPFFLENLSGMNVQKLQSPVVLMYQHSGIVDKDICNASFTFGSPYDFARLGRKAEKTVFPGLDKHTAAILVNSDTELEQVRTQPFAGPMGRRTISEGYRHIGEKLVDFDFLHGATIKGGCASFAKQFVVLVKYHFFFRPGTLALRITDYSFLHKNDPHIVGRGLAPAGKY
jgi:hypothetical protein